MVPKSLECSGTAQRSRFPVHAFTHSYSYPCHCNVSLSLHVSALCPSQFPSVLSCSSTGPHSWPSNVLASPALVLWSVWVPMTVFIALSVTFPAALVLHPSPRLRTDLSPCPRPCPVMDASRSLFSPLPILSSNLVPSHIIFPSSFPVLSSIFFFFYISIAFFLLFPRCAVLHVPVVVRFLFPFFPKFQVSVSLKTMASAGTYDPFPTKAPLGASRLFSRR